MNTTEEMIAAVRAHAKANYSIEGWDILVESYEDSQIREEIEGMYGDSPCTTNEEAIKRLGSTVGIVEERRFEVQAASGELEYYGIVERNGELVRE